MVSAECTFLGSLGYFQHVYYQDWYIYFTNHSNYFCFFIMDLELVETCKKSMRTDHDTVYPRLKYVASVYITITFVIFNFVLRNAPDRNPANNYTVNCVLLHVVLPIMFVADWVKNYRHGYVTIKDILSVAIYPLLYVGFALVRSFFVVVDPTNPYSKKYPYFFVNLDNLGWGGVIKWCVIILFAFELVAVLFYFLDKWLAKRKKFLRAKAKAEKEEAKAAKQAAQAPAATEKIKASSTSFKDVFTWFKAIWRHPFSYFPIGVLLWDEGKTRLGLRYIHAFSSLAMPLRCSLASLQRNMRFLLSRKQKRRHNPTNPLPTATGNDGTIFPI